MDFQLTNDIIFIGSYMAYIIWSILFSVLLFSLFKRNWELAKRTLKYLLNTIVFIIAFMFILELALIVRPAIYATKEASAVALKSWIVNHQFKDIYSALTTILILFGINLFFYFSYRLVSPTNRNFHCNLFMKTPITKRKDFVEKSACINKNLKSIASNA